MAYPDETKFSVPDGRIFVVPADEHLWAGNRLGPILSLEARTRTRLKDGENPVWFLRLHAHFWERRDPYSGVSFAEYASKMHPDKVEVVSPYSAVKSGGAGKVKSGHSGHLSAQQLAANYGLKADRVRKKLDRWRSKNPKGWVEVEVSGPREPKYLFDASAVKLVMESMKSSTKRPAK